MSSTDGDHDPVRRTPPADPWLTEAPTSALGGAASPGRPDPTAVEPPPADTARFDGPPSGWTEPMETPARRGRRATRWVVAILAVCALFIAGMLARDQFGDGDGDGDGTALAPPPSTAASLGAVPAVTRTGSVRKATPTAEPVRSGTTGPAAGGPVVVYEVTASGSKNTGSVSYTDQDGDIIRLNGIDLPWRITFAVTGQRKPLVLISQRQGGGDAGPVTCRITVDGKVLSSTTADGRYAAPQCSG